MADAPQKPWQYVSEQRIGGTEHELTPYTLQTLKDKKKGIQILLISPELLLLRRFIDEVLRDKSFTSQIFSVVVDEAHIVSHWGAGFRKRYGELGMLRAIIPRNTPFVAMSATLTAPVRHDVLRKLEYSSNYRFCDEGNDRPNVALVAQAIQQPQNTYLNLNFIIPKKVERASDIPLTMVYADSVAQSPDIVDHLEVLLPEHLRGCGLIRPFNAAFSHEYRTKALEDFKEGYVWVLVCTDAAGMVRHP
jgi:superfamily II DNA helicase RecQ